MEMLLPSEAASLMSLPRISGNSSLSMILYMWTVPPGSRRDRASGRNLSAICGRFMMMRSAFGSVGTTSRASPVMGCRASAWFSLLFMSAKRSASGFRSME